MKKPNLSSEAIKEFFLYHVEKLVFALGVILLGLFFWMGYQTKTFDKTDPKGLVAKTRSARQQMVRGDAWETIAPLRDGDDEVMTRIASAKAIDSDAFVVGPTSYPVKRDSLRRDLDIARPEKLIATVFSTQILVEPTRKIVDGLLEYEIAEVKMEENDDSMGMGPGGMGPGGMGPGGMGNGPGGMGPGGMGMGPGGMGMDGGETAAEKRKRERKEKAEEVNAGAFVSTAVKYRSKGIRPKSFSPTNVAAFNIDAVAVTGVINHKAMWKNFRDSYSKSFGYFPRRDTPVYDYLQIERREVGADGKPGEWLDISDRIAEQAEFFPSNMQTAPEVVSPPEYDGIITMPIPPLTGVDYKDFATHDLASLREFTVEEVKEEEPVDDGTIFAKNDKDKDNDDSFNSQYDTRSKRRRSAIDSGNGTGGGFGMGPGGMGMGPGGMGMGPGDMGMGPGGMGPGGMGMGMGMGMGGISGAGRKASNTSDFAKIDITKEPESDIKVVRFFDMQVKSNKTYQYRTRVWVRDPNNEDPELARSNGAGDMGMGGMGGPGMGGPGMGDMGMGGPGMGGGRKSGGKNKGKDGDDDEEKIYKKTPIASSMIDPKARERIKLAREEEVEGETVYYVSEKFDPAGDYVEVKVPKEHDYLRYARPSQWSDVVEAKVQTKDSYVYAGEPVEVRRIDLNDEVSIPASEPEMNIAAVKALRGGKLSGVNIPIRTTVRKGELLNFNEPAHVLHPVTWQVHKVTGLPVRTNQVVLDISGGERLGIKRSEPIQYQFPGEALVMDANGNIQLRNDLEDRGRYLAAALETDEKAEFGGKRKARREAKEKADSDFGMGMGGPGMGGMGPGMGGGAGGGGRGGRGGRNGGRGGR
jgi:hypothetical protein